jgi:uncharacterized alpha/beta hydrolase family protein
MRRFTLILSTILFCIFTLGLAAGEANTSEYQDRYIIASKTYLKVVPTRYNQIYLSVKRVDKSAARTMVTAARETCENTVNNAWFVGPNANSDHPPFDCYTKFRGAA